MLSVLTKKTCEGELLLVHVDRGARVGLDVGRESLLDLDDVPAATVEYHALVLGRADAMRRGMNITELALPFSSQHGEDYRVVE